jgi:glutamine phosphoribosylpyrophosphate amidotransferase
LTNKKYYGIIYTERREVITMLNIIEMIFEVIILDPVFYLGLPNLIPNMKMALKKKKKPP